MKSTKILGAVILLLVSSLQILAQGTQKLNVLYVGGSANWMNEHFEGRPEAEKEQDIKRRTASFEGMLKHYFTNVKTIDAKDYSQELSKSYDVTIFDGTPKAITERRTVKDSAGKITKYLPAGYLTEDFDEPVLFIGESGERLGRSIGLKLDWYCLCLDASALNFRKEHAIFKGPFPVKMTVETNPTPKEAFHYEYFLGKKTPATVSMWKVQTKGYISDKNFRVGMVARPWGFEDSPDAEFISSGVCQKTLDAVALGRHGNFFHWGFAASPEYMTTEGQTVLANAICYISKFNGKGVIARKYLDRRATREYLKELKYMSTKESYNSHAQMNRQFDSTMLSLKKVALDKKAKGDSLNAEDKRSLTYETQPESTYEEFLKRYQKGLFKQFGTNASAYAKYYDDNKNYFYSEDAMYVISIDEDVKSLGIPYYDKRLLDKAITMLEKGDDVPKAKRILERYTMADFTTPAQWRTWFEANKQNMFFTETGGYYFMINTYDRHIEGNDYKQKQLKLSYNNIRPGETDDNNAVSVAAGIVDKGDDKKEIVVKLRVHPGYHLYAYVAEEDPYIATDIKIGIPAGYRKTAEMHKPSFRYFSDSGTTMYIDEITFTQEVQGTGQGEATCSVTYQCCDSQICFPPVIAKEYRVSLN